MDGGAPYLSPSMHLKMIAISIYHRTGNSATLPAREKVSMKVVRDGEDVELTCFEDRYSCRLTRALSACFVPIALACCSNGPPAQPLERSVVLPGGVAVSEPYRLSPSDDVLIRFRFLNDLDEDALIAPDGTVSLRQIGVVKLAGLTVAEANDRLNDLYARVIREPTITLMVKSFALQQVYVAGEVNNPGVVRDTVPLTLSRAVAEAGGVKLSTARLSNVIIVRRLLDGSSRYYQIDMSNGATGKYGDPLLTSYDLVYVPEAPISQVADYVANNLLKMIPYSITTTTTATFVK